MIAFTSFLPLSPLLASNLTTSLRPASHPRSARVQPCAQMPAPTAPRAARRLSTQKPSGPASTTAAAAAASPSASPSTLATLLVSCPDRKGVVAVVAQLLFGFGCNILASDQYTDTSSSRYYQRVTFDYADLSVSAANVSVLERSIIALADEYSMSHTLTYHTQKKRVGILVSRTGHCLYDLLLRHRSGELPRSEVAVVISNHADLEHVARHFDVPFVHCPIDADAGGRPAQEEAMDRVLADHGAENVVLARYMQIMSPGFCERWAGRCINIHHSFLPSFQGGKPYHQAHKRGVKIIGATAHFVSDELDEGPIINQSIARVTHRDMPEDMIRKGRDLERVTLGTAIRWFLDDRIIVDGARTIVFED